MLTKIVLNINGQDIIVPIDQARKIYEELHSIFSKSPNPIMQPFMPSEPWKFRD